MKNKFNQSGIALLEVLIAFTIVMVTVVAIYQLQNNFIKSEYETSAYLSGLQLAESKLDDLRTFSELSSTASAAEDGYPSYEGVGNNVGGHKLSSGRHTVGIFNFDLNWISEENSNTKDVVVTVSGVNSTANITLFGSISRIQKIQEDKLSSISVTENQTPQTNYTPGDAPDVISVSLGEQLKQETTKPFPKVENGNGATGVEVGFQNITYNTDNNTQVMIDTSTVSCDCKFSSYYSSLDKTTTIPATPKRLNALLYWGTSKENKTWGVYSDTELNPSQYSNAATQSQTSVCDACCENHFKDNQSTLESYYNPLNYNGLGKYTAALAIVSSASPVSSGSYIDSCRVMRLDGYYSRVLTDAIYDANGEVQSYINYHYGQLLPDWNLVKINAMSYDFLSKSKNQENYVKYIKYVIGRYIQFQKENAGDLSGAVAKLSSTATQSPLNDYYIKSFNEWLQVSGNVTNGGDTTVDVYSDDLDSYQLIARGIFIDLLPTSWLDTISVTDSAGNYVVPDAELSKVSFSDVNLTLLSKWGPVKGGSDIAYVSNDSIKGMTTDNYDSDYYGTYKRGELTIPKKSTGNQTITVQALRGNASIAVYRNSSGDEIGVSPYENDSSKMISSSLNVIVATALPADKVIISGRVYCYDRKTTDIPQKNGTTKTDYSVDVCTSEGFGQISQPIISNNTGAATCSLDTDITGSSYRKLTCTVDKGSSLAIGFTKNGETLTNASSLYAITPDPISFTTTFTANSSDDTCVQVYDPNILTTNGIKLPNCNY